MGLKQIDLQTRSANAFNDPEVQKSLKLTADQTARVGADRRTRQRALDQAWFKPR
jgi:hypothetical protein